MTTFKETVLALPSSHTVKRIVITFLALFDIGTDWAAATKYYLDYRTIGPDDLEEKVQAPCDTTFDSPSLSRAESITTATSSAYFAFAAVGTILTFVRLFNRWFKEEKAPSRLVCCWTEACPTETLRKMVEQSPFMKDPWLAILCEQLAILLEDLPITAINFRITMETCEVGRGLQIFTLLSSIASALTSFHMVCKLCLHYASTFFKDSWFKTEDIERWSTAKKAVIYPLVIFLVLAGFFVTVSISMFALGVLAMFGLWVIIFCACVISGCRRRTDTERLHFFLHPLKAIFYDRPGELFRTFVLIVSIVICGLNVILFLTFGKILKTKTSGFGYMP